MHGRLSDCIDKYTDINPIKEYVIEQGMQTIPSLLIISDLQGKIRNKILKTMCVNCNLECLDKCIL